MARTKILATLGPASWDKVEELIEAGVDGFRFNMAHIRPEDYAKQAELVKRIRRASDYVFLSADLEGPKIRLGVFEPMNVNTGDELEVVPASKYDGKGVPVQFEELYKYVKKGNILLVDDGKVGLRVKDIRDKKILCEVEYGELIEKRKGINVPGVSVPTPFIEEKDERSLEFIIANDFDYVFGSYTRTPNEMRLLKRYLKGTGIRSGGKPENHEGMENIDGIIEEADIMMVPRGDLGMETGVMRIPAYQKMMIEKCNRRGVPIVTATQMLESMINSKEPTRAEVTDVFNAVLDGTAVVMLSGETSKGKYPVDAVDMMKRIAEEAEKYLFDPNTGIDLGERFNRIIRGENDADKISKAVYSLSKNQDIAAILIPTTTGYTAQMISRFRMEKPMIAFTYDRKVMRQLNAVWGITPIYTEQLGEDYITDNCIGLAKDQGYIKSGDKVIITQGIKKSGKGSTNRLGIETVE
jgi:pyruvate kinase